MYKLYYERDTILSSGCVLRGDIYIMDEQKKYYACYRQIHKQGVLLHAAQKSRGAVVE